MNQTTTDTNVRLVWCSPHPTHYNSYLFDHLVGIEGLSFETVYATKILTKYPWKTEVKSTYPVSYLNKTLGVDWSFLRRKNKNSKELLVIAGWNEPTFLMLLLWFSVIGRPFVLYSDTPDLRTRRGIKFFVRKIILNFIFKKTYRFLVTGMPGVQHAKRLGIQTDRIVNFPFATNLDFFVPRFSFSTEQNCITFISSGRLDNAHKGYDVAIEAFALLKKEFPEYTFRYRIAGDGPDKSKLEDLIRAKDLDREVELLGWLEPSELLAFYQSGDVLVHSSHFDPFPNAVLEAMACGLPVVGSDAAGSVIDRVKEGENGYVHKRGDSKDLCRALSAVLQQSLDERKAMGVKARETALQWKVNYHQTVIENMIKEFHELAQN